VRLEKIKRFVAGRGGIDAESARLEHPLQLELNDFRVVDDQRLANVHDVLPLLLTYPTP